MFFSKESRITVLVLALVASLTVLSHSIDVTTVVTTSTITEVATVTAPAQPKSNAETVLNTATNIIQTMQFLFNCAPFKWKGPLKITSCTLNFIVLLLTAWGYLLKYLQENKLNSDADMEQMVKLSFGEMASRVLGKGVGKTFTKMDINQRLVYPFERKNREKCLIMTVGEGSIVPFHDLSTEICFDRNTLDSLSHRRDASVSTLDTMPVNALGFADIPSGTSIISELYTNFGDYTVEVLGGIMKLVSAINREGWQREKNGFVVMSRDRPNEMLLSVHMYGSDLL
ncbi:YNL033W [Saccharomyces arboricola H-6]|uniref:YNL033W n=1 Tax=Saccharomyces arboricola (strain H-6 / AS 2.3317 / CBS 10644) TaxID=1160507 RepID=J8PZT4_SACAR|nr:YNL033W [Saccharomyces arboricola H-6]